MIGRAEIEAAVAAHGRVAVAVVIEAKGSSPRDAGTAMLIFDGGILGTIGGGTVEHRVIEAGRKLLAQGGHPQVLCFPLGPDLDQCCGGQMTIEIGIVDRDNLAGLQETELWPGGPRLPASPEKRPIIIYGAGHVGQALTRALALLPFSTTLVDAKPNAQPTPVDVHVTPLPEAVAEEAADDAFHIVMTHSHAIDLEIVTAVLNRSNGFCGLIGSATKRELFQRRLAERGVPPDSIASLVCPIGLPGLRDKRPEVIAASIAAQLLLRDAELRNNT